MDRPRSDPANCHQAGEMIHFQPRPMGLILRCEDHPLLELRPALHLFLRQQPQARLHPWLRPRKRMLKSRLCSLARSRLRSSNSSKRVIAFFTLGVPVSQYTSLFYSVALNSKFAPKGTGKSVLLREIIKTLRKKHIKTPDAVAITASTGEYTSSSPLGE